MPITTQTKLNVKLQSLADPKEWDHQLVAWSPRVWGGGGGGCISSNYHARMRKQLRSTLGGAYLALACRIN